MPKQVLITGGAGFIGSHLVDTLLRDGHAVRVLDNLDAQGHGADAPPPEYLDAEVEFQQGDVRDRDAVRAALQGVDVVYHLAAAVSVGQSMYEMRHYMDVNTVGTSVLLEAILHHPIERLVVASSMSLYCDPQGAVVENVARDPAAVREGHWEPTKPDGTPLTPLQSLEWKKPALASVYALSKHDQERLCLMAGNAYGTYTPPSLGLIEKTSAPPRVPKQYADFIDAFLSAYGEAFEYVELWNEPNNLAEWDYTRDPHWTIFAEMIGVLPTGRGRSARRSC